MNKIIMCREILMGMAFLNIPSERYMDLKKQLGSAELLHNYISEKLIK